MTLFNSNPGENDAHKVVRDENRVLAYRRSIASTLNDLHTELGRLNNDLKSANTALQNVVARSNFALVAERMNIIGHLTKLVRIYREVGRLRRTGEPLAIAEASRTIEHLLNEIVNAMRNGTIVTKQDLAGQLSRVYTANSNLNTYLEQEQSRVYGELEMHTNLLRRTS